MNTKNISRLWDVVKPAPRPGRGNPIPTTTPEPDQEPSEPQPARGPKRKKKGIYEIEFRGACC